MIRTNRPGMLTVLPVFLGLSSKTLAHDICGDVDRNGRLDMQNLVEFSECSYIARAEPLSKIAKGEVNPFLGPDAGDVTYSE